MRPCELKRGEYVTENENSYDCWEVAMWVPTMSHCPARRDEKVKMWRKRNHQWAKKKVPKMV